MAREALFLPRARYDLTNAHSRAIWLALEVKVVASQHHDFMILAQAVAGPVVLEAHFIASPIWRQPIVHSVATRLETRESRVSHSLMAVSVFKSVPAVQTAARVVEFLAPAHWCCTHALSAETWAAMEVQQTELQQTEVQKSRARQILTPNSYGTFVTAGRAARAGPAVFTVRTV